MRSYFKDLLNRVKVGKATSDWNVMKGGCPQGSSFGPTLWNLYQNDLSYHINEIADLNMYADDHQMYIVGSDMSIMQGAKKIIFTACHSGKVKLAFTSPDVISTSPKNFLFFCYSNSS